MEIKRDRYLNQLISYIWECQVKVIQFNVPMDPLACYNLCGFAVYWKEQLLGQVEMDFFTCVGSDVYVG